MRWRINMELLERTRKISSILQRATAKSVNYNEMAVTLQQIIGANIFVVSNQGELLGFSINQKIENPRMIAMLEERQFPKVYTESLFNIQTTTANLDIDSPYTAFPVENKDLFKDGLTTVVPIIGRDRKSTRLNSSHVAISYAVFCLKKKKNKYKLEKIEGQKQTCDMSLGETA